MKPSGQFKVAITVSTLVFAGAVMTACANGNADSGNAQDSGLEDTGNPGFFDVAPRIDVGTPIDAGKTVDVSTPDTWVAPVVDSGHDVGLPVVDSSTVDSGIHDAGPDRDDVTGPTPVCTQTIYQTGQAVIAIGNTPPPYCGNAPDQCVLGDCAFTSLVITGGLCVCVAIQPPVLP